MITDGFRPQPCASARCVMRRALGVNKGSYFVKTHVVASVTLLSNSSLLARGRVPGQAGDVKGYGHSGASASPAAQR